jgi:hypothetical protein
LRDRIDAKANVRQSSEKLNRYRQWDNQDYAGSGNKKGVKNWKKNSEPIKEESVNDNTSISKTSKKVRVKNLGDFDLRDGQSGLLGKMQSSEFKKSDERLKELGLSLEERIPVEEKLRNIEINEDRHFDNMGRTDTETSDGHNIESIDSTGGDFIQNIDTPSSPKGTPRSGRNE